MEALPDVLLLVIRCLFGQCTLCSSVARLFFMRLVVQFGLALTELGLLEMSINEGRNETFYLKPTTIEKAVRYSVVGSLTLYLGLGIWCFHYVFFKQEESNDSKATRKLWKIFGLFKFMDAVIDAILLAYCAVLFNDFEVALPFFAIPRDGVNLKAWIISLVTFLDIIFGIVEFIMTIYKLCKKNEVGPDPD